MNANDTVGETLKDLSAKVLQPASLSLLVVQQGVNKPLLHMALCDRDLTIFHHKNYFTQNILQKFLKLLIHFRSLPSLCSAAHQTSSLTAKDGPHHRSFCTIFFQYCWQNNSDSNATDCNQM